MKMKVKRLTPRAHIPRYAHPGDAGLDLQAMEDRLLSPGESILVGTGISIALPENTEAQVRPRSGLALKHGITVLNSPGTIDCGYRGEIKVILINHGSKPFSLRRGMKIAQMVVQPVCRVEIEESDELPSSNRGEGGFGSSGR